MSDLNPEHPETFAFLQNRRSVPAKTMSGPGPGENEVRALIEIASRVPDHGKIAPWHFVQYGPDYCVKLGEMIEARFKEINTGYSDGILEIERGRFTRVPVVIGVISAPKEHSKVPQWEQVLSAGAAAMNLLTGANALGYDAQWLTEWVAFDDVLAPKFGVKPGEKIAGFIHIGTKQMPKTERDRPQIDDVFSIMTD
ncbi:MAG: nitroreductase [Hyphomicrobiales bacterium]|nr:MAG: nitroreductase [Hyphomicrobiales bacterium]